MPHSDVADDAAARRRNIESLLPLAPLQEGILVHSLDTPEGSAVYMPQMAYHLSGPIDPDRLRAAWAQVLARHSALRSATGRTLTSPAPSICPRLTALPLRCASVSRMAPCAASTRTTPAPPR